MPAASRPSCCAPLRLRAVLDHFVGHAERAHRNRDALRGERGEHRVAEAADRAVLLDDHERAAATRELGEPARIDRLREARVQHRGRDAVLLEPLRCLERGRDRVTERDDADVAAVAQQLRLADLQASSRRGRAARPAPRRAECAAPRGPGTRSRSSASGAARSRPWAPSGSRSAACAGRRCRTGPGASRRRRRPGPRGRART